LECARILKPGGHLAFLYDVETENPLIGRFKRRDAALYNRLFLEGDGHVGYQSSAENLALFVAHGFRVVFHRGLEKSWVQSPNVYQKLAEFDSIGRRALKLMGVVTRAPWFYLYTAIVRLVDASIGSFLPSRWARIDLTVCEKVTAAPRSASEICL
jgi:hypothetical protein